MAAKKTQSLNEFKAWLEGIEELQSKGWSPDKSQWTKIRNRIRNIVDEIPAPAPLTTMPMAPAPQQMGYAPAPPPSPWMPPQQSFIPPDVEISPAAKALLSGGKTPDLDSSNGPIDSSFE